jgi:virulence factor Mce-like protein
MNGSAMKLVLACLAVVIAVVLTTSSSSDGDRIVEAEFDDVRGLLVNNDVRVNGARTGKVVRVRLTDRGTAMVAMRLDHGVPRPRTDAAATVRPVDLLGDIYLSYSPGTSKKELAGPIPLARTMNVPRLADLLRAFQPGARAGLQAMIVELSAGLERRGVDLNRAAAELRPAVSAVDGVMEELGSEQASLRTLVTNTHRVARQVRERKNDMASTVDALATTLQTTGEHAQQLDRGLDRLAPTLAQLTATGGGLASTAGALRPLATELHRAAPGLAQAADELPDFLSETKNAAAQVRPTLRRTTDLLRDARPTASTLSRALSALQTFAPHLLAGSETLRQATPPTADAVFVNLTSEGREPGNQPTDPTTTPLRHYWRGAATLNCTSFGLRIKPGCLEDVLAGVLKRTLQAGSEPAAGGLPKLPKLPKLDLKPPPKPAPPERPATDKLPSPFGKALGKTIDGIDDLLDNGAGDKPVSQLLDYLLGP